MSEPIFALTYVELDIEVCENTYGVAPCTASGPASAKCFNCLATCQDVPNFSAEIVTLRFSIGTDYLPDDIDAIPIIDAVQLSPGKISLGRDLGQRSSLSVTLADIPWSDTGPGFDPYHAERDYDPFKQGTLWGKFRARQPYLRGRAIRIIRGIVGQTLAAMETRHFVVESFEGPTPDGKFTITAKDVLKLLDGDRAQVPAVSEARFGGGIDDNDTAVTLTPTGIGNADFPASGYANLGGKEIAAYTRVGDAMTLTARGQLGTTAASHASSDRIQPVLRYSGEDPADIIYDFMMQAGVHSAFIDLPAWQAETAAYNSRLYTGTVAEPTSAKALIEEMIEQAGLAIWWDDRVQTIRLMVIRPVTTDAELFDDSNIIEDRLSISEQPDKRITQVWTYFAQANPLEGQEDPNNYRSLAVTVEAAAETAYGAPAIHKIFSRWIPDGGRTTATKLNDLLLSRYSTAPRQFSFSVFRDGVSSPTLGEGCRLGAFVLQDAFGGPMTAPIQIVRLDPDATEYRVEAEEMLAVAQDDGERFITIDADGFNLNLRAMHDQLYPTLVGGETVNFALESWVEIGSTSTSVASIVTGTWPSQSFTATRSTSNGVLTGISDTSDFVIGQAITGPGIPNDARVTAIVLNTSVTIDKTPTIAGSASLTLWTVIVNFDVRGLIGGRGGRGGNGKGGNDNPGDMGEKGGDGLKVTAPINLTGNGRIRGGGAGGGGEGGDWNGWFGPQVDGGGGGGGAGLPPGAGGTPGALATNGAGQPGTQDAGGLGGPGTFGSRGGNGGAPGQNGTNAGGAYPGWGGTGGKSVDGASLLKDTAFTGTYAGSQIN